MLTQPTRPGVSAPHMLDADTAHTTEPRTPAEWANWFHTRLMPSWLLRARDDLHGGFFDQLSEDGIPVADAPKTTLVQARLLFTLSHLYQLKRDPRFLEAAHQAHVFLSRHLQDAERGGYVYAVNRDGSAMAQPENQIKRSYDQAFVLLALVTYGRVAPSTQITQQTQACWSFIDTHLTEPATGALFEDDTGLPPADGTAPLRAQNPHMHLFEATVQAFEMTGDPAWLQRAGAIRAVVTRHFFDAQTGTIREFCGPALLPATGEAGALREIGHQCEWAWLLHRYARLGGDASALGMADALMRFAGRHGFQTQGPMAGAAYDAVYPDGRIMADTMLLWPQTEAAKAYTARFEQTGHDDDADRAHSLALLVFQHYFAGRAAWRNQVDTTGRTLQPDALSRLLYHVAVFVTEGERVGLWPTA